jgi:chorismate lyase/3-hydroxybenzoate synthase
MNILGVMGTSDQVPSETSLLYVNLGTPTIGHTALFETIYSTNIPIKGTYGYITYNYDSEKIFGFATVMESADNNLQSITNQVYDNLFKVIDNTGYKILWRVWNYIPDINGEDELGERYKQFNAGRSEAFDLAGYPKGAGSPAACGVGTDSKYLTICFLAGRDALYTIENPRQVSSYNYPAKYGKFSPIFSRAATLDYHEKRILFISGTASIEGHETKHIGDVVLQTEETFINIRTLLDQAPYIDPNSLIYKVYIRHPHQLHQVKRIVEKYIRSKVIYVKADLCRIKLDVEIEATPRILLDYMTL